MERAPGFLLIMHGALLLKPQTLNRGRYPESPIPLNYFKPYYEGPYNVRYRNYKPYLRVIGLSGS